VEWAGFLEVVEAVVVSPLDSAVMLYFQAVVDHSVLMIRGLF
jgi:hypothetical protein